jgi:hypothetical protein
LVRSPVPVAIGHSRTRSPACTYDALLLLPLTDETTGLPYEAHESQLHTEGRHSFNLSIERGIVRTEGRNENEAFVDHDGASSNPVDT